MNLMLQLRKSLSVFIKYILCGSLSLLMTYQASSQTLKSEAIKTMVSKYKEDVRGPYKDIRWFCTDGTFRVPQERCPEPSPQRARYKDEVVSLGESNHIFIGQILSTTPFDAFWDAANSQSRLKQYQLQKYLQLIDNGWALRKAQYYRGAFQIEDEEAWGQNFFKDLLKEDGNVDENYFLIREAIRDLPHGGDDNLNQRIRANALVIANDYAPFMNLRIKLHGQPDETDLEAVRAFRKQHGVKLNSKLVSQLNQLITDLETNYKPVETTSFTKYLNRLPREAREALQKRLTNYNSTTDLSEKIDTLSQLLVDVREWTSQVKSGPPVAAQHIFHSRHFG